MKKIIVILVILVFIIYYCQYVIFKPFGGGASVSVLKSKEAGVFCNKYIVFSEKTNKSNLINLNIKECWAEYSWNYSGHQKIHTDTTKFGFQIIILLENKLEPNFFSNYYMKAADDNGFGTRNRNLCVSRRTLPDSLTYYIFADSVSRSSLNLINLEEKSVGSFTLIKQ